MTLLCMKQPSNSHIVTTLCVRTTHNTSLSLNVWKQFFGQLIENLHTQCFFRTFATLMILKCRNIPD